jgi:hypothetical protein
MVEVDIDVVDFVAFHTEIVDSEFVFVVIVIGLGYDKVDMIVFHNLYLY